MYWGRFSVQWSSNPHFHLCGIVVTGLWYKTRKVRSISVTSQRKKMFQAGMHILGGFIQTWFGGKETSFFFFLLWEINLKFYYRWPFFFFFVVKKNKVYYPPWIANLTDYGVANLTYPVWSCQGYLPQCQCTINILLYYLRSEGLCLRKFLCWSPSSQCDGIWRWGLWEVIRFKWSHEGGVLITGIVP